MHNSHTMGYVDESSFSAYEQACFDTLDDDLSFLTCAFTDCRCMCSTVRYQHTYMFYHALRHIGFLTCAMCCQDE